MEPRTAYAGVVVAGVAFSALAAVGVTFVRAPYGRFGATGFGPTLPVRLGWIVMEAPAPLAFAWGLATGTPRPITMIFAAMWAIWYLNRGLVFPLRLRVRPGAQTSVTVVGLGALVTTTHGGLFGTWLGRWPPDVAWLADPRFWLGSALFVAGFAVNVLADATLRALRSETSPGGYAIPRGGAFRWVSCPNYLGEIVAWLGYTLATGCPGGAFIVAITLANLVPRAIATHRWYRANFADYPADRRALVPFLL